MTQSNAPPLSEGSPSVNSGQKGPIRSVCGGLVEGRVLNSNNHQQAPHFLSTRPVESYLEYWIDMTAYQPGSKSSFTPGRIILLIFLLGAGSLLLWFNQTEGPIQTPEPVAPSGEPLPELLAPAPGAPPPEFPYETIRIVSWNIEWFPGRSPQPAEEDAARHLMATRRALPPLEGDVFLLQEMAGFDEVVELFAELEGFVTHIVSRFLWRGGLSRQQLAVVSRLPALAAFYERHDAPNEGPTPPRGFAFAALELPNGQSLLVYTVHLKSNLGEAESNIRQREEAARQILSHARSMEAIYPGSIVVIGGDFNTLLDQPAMAHERTMEIFKDAGYEWTWEGVPFEERVTWNARGRFGDANFDHFLVKNAPHPVRAKVLPQPDVSDHNPIAIDLRIPLGQN
jgi:endonuclease/exonuclease/phosphatase family metal-dependent hydrolase